MVRRDSGLQTSENSRSTRLMAPYYGRPASLLFGEARNQCILLELPCGVSALSKRYHGIKGGLRLVEFGRATYLVRMSRIARADW